MPRYIDADNLIGDLHNTTFIESEDRRICYSRIQMQPTADVVERNKGEWIDKEIIEDRKDSKIQEWQQARCSVCNKWHTTPYMYYFDNYNYCPNCGADMRGENLNE